MPKCTYLLLLTALLMSCATSTVPQRATTPRVDPLAAMESSLLFERAQAASIAGDYIRAQQYYTASMARGQDPTEVMPLLIEACIQGRRYETALSHAQSELRRMPESLQLRLMVAALHMALGDKEKAEWELRKILLMGESSTESSAEAHFALGSLLWGGPDGSRAREHLRRYVELEPMGAHVIDAKLMLATETSAQGTLVQVR